MAREPEKPSLAEVYDEHVWDVYGFIGYRVRSREQVEDLTQTTFLRALKAWDRFDPERGAAKTWLFAIARNVVIDHYRSEPSGREAPLPEELGQDPEAAALAERGLGPTPALAAGLEALTSREREVIALRFGGDMTGAQIAELTGLSLANVQQILSRSLRRLRAALAGEAISGREGPEPGEADGGDGEQGRT